MKTAFKIVAWLGIIIVIFGAIVSFWESFAITFSYVGVDFGHFYAAILGIIGLILMLPGGFVSKPKYFWQASIITGSFFIISFFGLTQFLPNDFTFDQTGVLLQLLAISVLPGLIMIAEGIALKRMEAKKLTKKFVNYV